MLEAMKCLSLGAEVAERSCFSQFSLARVVPPGGKAATSPFIALPKTQQLAGELAAPLSHLHPPGCRGVLGWSCISHCALCWVQPEWEEPEERSGGPCPMRIQGGELCSHKDPGALLLLFLPTTLPQLHLIQHS